MLGEGDEEFTNLMSQWKALQSGGELGEEDEEFKDLFSLWKASN